MFLKNRDYNLQLYIFIILFTFLEVYIFQIIHMHKWNMS